MNHLKWTIAIIIFLIALISGYWPFHKKQKTQAVDFSIGESIASGVFLGAGLIHMLGDASSGFIRAGYRYPYAFLLAGVSFLFLLLLEHIANEMDHQRKNNKNFAIIASLMLSIHSLLEGTALGISGNLLTALVLSAAIIAHKWAASFALSLQINKSGLTIKTGWILFILFALMTPVGVLLGADIMRHTNQHVLLAPVFSALAAGTFLYIGTLHGLRRATMIERCCNMKEFGFMIFGFALMAVVAMWT